MRILGLAIGLLAAIPSLGRPGMLAVAGIGEVGYMDGYDMANTTGLPQIGFAVEYRTRAFALYNAPSVGYYIGRPVLEDYLGGEVGWDFAWARPGLTLGIGVQTYYRQRFRGMSDDFDREFQVRYPIGLGVRLWLFRSFYGEWQSRLWDWKEGDGIPAWKMEFGYKVI